MKFRVLLVVGVVFGIGGAAAALLVRGTGWDAVDPGLVVVLSETEVAMTSSWTCNVERVRIDEFSSAQLVVVFERADQEAYNACGVGDCGVSMSPPSEVPALVAASDCGNRFVLTEPLGGRELRVLCEACVGGFAAVQDER